MQMKARKNLLFFTPVLFICGSSSFLDTGSILFSSVVIASEATRQSHEIASLGSQ
jgi:hypothetical protein